MIRNQPFKLEMQALNSLYGLSGNLTLISCFLGCRDGAVVRALASHQCGPSSIPRSVVKYGLSLFVLYSALRGFPRELRFPLSSKTKL